MAAVASTCANCGGDFVAQRVDNRTCSARCKKAYQRQRQRQDCPASVLEAHRLALKIVSSIDTPDDRLLLLSYVVWPSPGILDALEARAVAA